MKADTFAKFLILDAIVEAEVGYFLRYRPSSLNLREEVAARVGDLIDNIDALDSVAAGRAYDAIVDLLAELPEEDDDGIIAAAVRFRRAIERVIARGLDRSDLASSSTWAIVLDELLEEFAREYGAAGDAPAGPLVALRVDALLARIRQAADRLLWVLDGPHPAIASDVDRLVYATSHRRTSPDSVDPILRSLRRRVARFRPSPISRVGVFIVRQLVRRGPVKRRRRARGAGR